MISRYEEHSSVPELTHQNYLKWTYDGRSFALRRHRDEALEIHYTPVPRFCGDFFEESVHAARLIAERADGNVWVAFSGGADSETCLLSFMKAGVEPVAATVRFARGHNQTDMDFAFKFCRDHGIRHEVFDLDVEEFWRDRLAEYAEPIQCVSPQFPVTLWLIDQMEGFPVVASGDSFLARESGSRIMSFFEQEKYLSYHRHLVLRDREGAPAFFQYTPQLVLSYMRDESLQRFIAGEAHQRKILTAKHFKCEVYRKYFDLDYRRAINGFESLQSLDHFHRTQLVERFPNAGSTLQIECGLFTRMLDGLCHGNQPATFRFSPN